MKDAKSTFRNPLIVAGILIITVALAIAVLTAVGITIAQAQDDPKSLPSLTLSSPNPGELVITWTAPANAPEDYRVAWAPADQSYLSYRDANEQKRGNAYPGGSATSHTLTGLPENTKYKVNARARYNNGSGPWREAKFTVSGTPSPTQQPTPEPTQQPTAEPTQEPASSDAALGSLWISSGTLTPAFSSATTSYSASVDHEVTTVTVDAKTSHMGATFAISPADADADTAGDQVSLSVGPNSVSVVVTAEDGTSTQTYSITITRNEATGPVLSSLSLGTEISLSPSFDSAITSYTAAVGDGMSVVTVAADGGDDTVSIIPGDADGNTTGHQVNVSTGGNVIQIGVASSSDEANTYWVTVVRGTDRGLADGLRVVPSRGTLAVSWDAPSNPDDRTPTDYRVSWARADGSYASWRDESRNAFPTTTSRSVKELASGYYKVRVRARYRDGLDAGNPWNGPWLEIFTGRVRGSPPTAPGGLTATAASDGGSVALSWTAPVHDGITGYRISRGVAADSLSTLVEDTGGTDATYSDDSVSPGETYHYRVAALSLDGASPGSSAVSVAVPEAATPATPEPFGTIRDASGQAVTNLVVTSDLAGALDFSWTAPSVTPLDYEVNWYLGWETQSEWPDSDYTEITPATKHFVSNLEMGKQGKVRVRARYRDARNDDRYRYTPWTTPVAVSIAWADAAGRPPAPTGFTATKADGVLNLAWADPDDDTITGYQILRRDPYAPEVVAVVNTGNVATVNTDLVIPPFGWAHYRVRAINANGPGHASNSGSVDGVEPIVFDTDEEEEDEDEQPRFARVISNWLKTRTIDHESVIAVRQAPATPTTTTPLTVSIAPRPKGNYPTPSFSTMFSYRWHSSVRCAETHHAVVYIVDPESSSWRDGGIRTVALLGTAGASATSFSGIIDRDITEVVTGGTTSLGGVTNTRFGGAAVYCEDGTFIGDDGPPAGGYVDFRQSATLGDDASLSSLSVAGQPLDLDSAREFTVPSRSYRVDTNNDGTLDATRRTSSYSYTHFEKYTPASRVTVAAETTDPDAYVMVDEMLPDTFTTAYRESLSVNLHRGRNYVGVFTLSEDHRTKGKHIWLDVIRPAFTSLSLSGISLSYNTNAGAASVDVPNPRDSTTVRATIGSPSQFNLQTGYELATEINCYRGTNVGENPSEPPHSNGHVFQLRSAGSQASAECDLDVGVNTIVVSAWSGESRSEGRVFSGDRIYTYTITVNRAAS